MPEHMETLLQQIPQQPQRQDSTHAQLADLYAVSIRLGLYDAADAIRAITDRRKFDED